MNHQRLILLKQLLTQPTAPFREQWVIDCATQVLRDAGVPFFLDPIGNVVIGCGSPRDYRRLVQTKTDEPVRIYIAHMDHPGFHGVRWRKANHLQVEWHGGAPVRHLSGARVWLADNAGGSYRGRLRAAKLSHGGRTIGTAEVVIDDSSPARLDATGLYGGFGFRAPVWQSGRLLYTKAADDLVGVYTVLVTALDLFRKRTAAPPFLGLLTRAEEVGFIGAIGHFELGWLKRACRPVLCLSLETSRTLAGAEIGKGPVVRLGDRRTVFSPNAINVLTQVAQRVLPGRHQRRIMDGGTCEATAATVYGLTAFGISVPLGNYHNQGLEGGPDCRGKNGPAPEFVHLSDVDGAVILCRALLRPGLPWDKPWDRERRAYQKKLRDYRAFL